nr:hypothetical protein [Tanacetum cinerariifolium]
MRDFHKTHPSGSGIVTKTSPSVAKIKYSVTCKGTGIKPGVPDVTEGESSEINTDKRFVQDEGTNAAMTNVQQGNKNPEIIQVIKDAHVTFSTVPQNTEVLVTSSSHSSDLAARFLNFSDFTHTDAKIVSPMDVYVHHEVPSHQTSTLLTIPVSVISYSSPVFSTIIPVTTLQKEVAKLKKNDPLKTQVTELVDKHLDARLGATRDKFMNFLSTSITTRITEQVKNQLPHILLKEVSNFAPPVIQSMVNESLEQAVLAKESSQPQSSYESVQSEEPGFVVADSDMPQDQEENPGNDDQEPKEKVASKRDWFTKPTQPQEPTDPNWNKNLIEKIHKAVTIL